MMKKITTWALALSFVMGLGFATSVKAADDAAKGGTKTPAATADSGAAPTTTTKSHKHHKHHKKAATDAAPEPTPSK